jgi:hypothetical protein
VDTPANGSCFFYSVSYTLNNPHSDDDAIDVRHDSVRLLMKVVEERKSEYGLMYYEQNPDIALGSDEYDVLDRIVDSLSMLLDDTRILSSARSSHTLPSPKEINKWLESRKRVLRRKDTWAYTDLMHFTARAIPHNITIIAFPYMWYKAGQEVQGTNWISRVYVHDVGRGYEIEQEGMLETTIFIQYVGNHYQSIVFLSTDRVDESEEAEHDLESRSDRSLVHAVPTWQRYVWVQRIARYWGFPRSGMESVEDWRMLHKCGYRMQDGSLCSRRLGHDESIPHAS